MTDEEIKPHLEAVIRWIDHKLKSGEGSWKDKYYYIGVLDNLRTLLTNKETMSQFFERRILNPHHFPHEQMTKVYNIWMDDDNPKQLEEII